MRTTNKFESVRETRFENASLTRVGAESMTLAQLRAIVPLESRSLPERVDFYMLMRIESGSGRHTVDFVDCRLKPGSLVFVRPGQVHQWYASKKMEGQLLLIVPAALDSAGFGKSTRDTGLLVFDDWPAVTQLSGDADVEITQSMKFLAKDLARFDDSSCDISIIQHSLLALLLRIARWHDFQEFNKSGQYNERQVYRRFRTELEKTYHQRPGVRQLAQCLGYSESTLSRACRIAESRSAKQVIDRRIALEAQRLLVRSAASVATIGLNLGFSEPTNFVKFSGRMIGMPPAAFRAKMTGGR